MCVCVCVCVCVYVCGVEIRLGLFHLLDKVSVYCCMIK